MTYISGEEVESYLRIMGEPKLPSSFLQVICWVFGEYGTADGKYSASYITGKLYDVAEAHSTDDTIKAYAVTALMKIYSFEIAAGKKVDVLPECQSLIEEMLASHSTDLQQRAYELQAILSLDVHVIVHMMPRGSACEDIEIDKNLSFLDGYAQEALEKGAEPYIEHLRMSNNSDFNRQEDHEVSTHALRFEAYELPKASPPVLASSNALVPVPDPSYVAYIPQPAQSFPSTSDAELKLRLDGVQKKWGRPSYSSVTPPSSSTNTVKIQNESTQYDSVSTSNSKARNISYDLKKQQVEVSPEKQKLAASLFGGASKSVRRQTPSSQKVPKSATSDAAVIKASEPPPDLLDLGEPSVTSSTPAIDPFKQLEGLLDLTQGTTSTSGAPDFKSIFADTSLSDSVGNPESNGIDINGVGGSTELSNGLNLKEALEKDARVRQLGVITSGQNPNLFKDLLG